MQGHAKDIATGWPVVALASSEDSCLADNKRAQYRLAHGSYLTDEGENSVCVSEI